MKKSESKRISILNKLPVLSEAPTDDDLGPLTQFLREARNDANKHQFLNPPSLTPAPSQINKDVHKKMDESRPNLPEFEVHPNAPRGNWKTSQMTNEDVGSEIQNAYENIVYFRQNLMPPPSGGPLKDFMNEQIFWLKQINEPTSPLNAMALKAFMVLADLLLQKPSRNSKAKDNANALKRRLQEWKDGNVSKLLKEAQHIQEKLVKFHLSHRSKKDTASTFANLVCQGNIGGALKLLSDQSSNGVMPLTKSVIKELEEKHPNSSPIMTDDSLLRGPLQQIEAYSYDEIDEEFIKKVALNTKGSAGPSGMHAECLRALLCSNRHPSESKTLREQIAMLTRQLLTKSFDPILLEGLVACRLIPLAKGSDDMGVRPIGVGETLRRVMGKAVSWHQKGLIKASAGPLQTCASHGAGAEAAIHGMRKIFDSPESEAVLLIDAKNAFNSLNRAAAMHNLQVQCPSLAKYIINTYRKPSRLFITGSAGDKLEIASEEGGTQGDPLVMGWYAISTTLMIESSTTDGVSQVWLADDAAGAGKLESLLQWYEKLEDLGKKWGYNVNGKKSWLITKRGLTDKAKKIFGDKVNVTDKGMRHLGASLGSETYKDEYSTEKVEAWMEELRLLCDVAVTQPQAAYIAYKYGFASKFTYFQRTIEDFGKYLKPIQELLESKFIPTLFGMQTSLSKELLQVMSLPVKNGGLGITNVVDDAKIQFEGSSKITQLHTESIMRQESILPLTDSEGCTQAERIAENSSKKSRTLLARIEEIDSCLPDDLLQFVKRARDKGAGSWLNALPLACQGFNLNKGEFRDALRLRYNIPIEELPSSCVCGDRFNTVHALSCKKGGFVSQRHDNVKDLFTGLLDKCCTNVESEPHLMDLEGETFRLRTANTAPGARLDIKARNFWRQGQDAYFDIRVTHVNALSQKDLTTDSIFKRQENEKKREYSQRVLDVERGTFTPLVIGTNGGMGVECQMFVKQLSELLSRKLKEPYSSTITWIRTKLSFEVLKSAILCIRGSRTPWKAKKINEDFALLAQEAGLNIHE